MPPEETNGGAKETLPQGTPARLPIWRILAFAVGAVPAAITHSVIGFFLTPFLLEVARVPPSLAANVVLIGRIIDAVTDPLVGYLTLRTRTRWGRYRPWYGPAHVRPRAASTPRLTGASMARLFLSSIPCALSYFAIWVVPPFSMTALFAYYLAVYCLFQVRGLLWPCVPAAVRTRRRTGQARAGLLHGMVRALHVAHHGLDG